MSFDILESRVRELARRALMTDLEVATQRITAFIDLTATDYPIFHAAALESIAALRSGLFDLLVEKKEADLLDKSMQIVAHNLGLEKQ